MHDFVVPEGWEVAPFGSVVGKFIDYRGRTPKKLGMDWGGSIPAISAVNVKPGSIDFTGCKHGSKNLYDRWMQAGHCQEGDILITMEAPLGHVAQIPDNKRYILSQRVLLVRTGRDKVSANFLAQLMRSESFQSELQRRATGTTAKGIQRARLVKVPILLPPLPEQRKIAAILTSVDETIQATQAVIDQTRRVKEGLLQDLLTKGIGHTRFKKTPIGEVPESWEVVRLGDVCCTITKGTTPPKEFMSRAGQIPYLRVGNLTFNNVLNLKDLFFVPKYIHEGVLKRSIVLPGDILTNIVGPPLGKVALVGNCFNEYNINQAIAVFRPKADYILASFVSNILMSGRVKRWLLARAKQTSGQVNLTLKLCCDIPVLLPSIREQEKMTSILSSVDETIHENEARLQQLQQVNAGLLQDLLTGKVRVSV